MVISIRGGKYWLWRAVDNEGEVLDFLVQHRRDAQAAEKLMVKLLKKHGFAPSRVVTDRLRSYPAAFRAVGITAEHDRGLRANNRAENSHQPIRRRERNCRGSNHPAQPNVSSPSMPLHSTHSPINVICCADRISRSFAPVHSALGPRHPPPHDTCCPLHSPPLNADNVTKPFVALPLGCFYGHRAPSRQFLGTKRMCLLAECSQLLGGRLDASQTRGHASNHCALHNNHLTSLCGAYIAYRA